jgi:hypothetical protein
VDDSQTASSLFLFELLAVVYHAFHNILANVGDDHPPMLKCRIIPEGVEFIQCCFKRTCETPHITQRLNSCFGKLRDLLDKFTDFFRFQPTFLALDVILK